MRFHPTLSLKYSLKLTFHDYGQYNLQGRMLQGAKRRNILQHVAWKISSLSKNKESILAQILINIHFAWFPSFIVLWEIQNHKYIFDGFSGLKAVAQKKPFQKMFIWSFCDNMFFFFFDLDKGQKGGKD